MLCFRPWGIQGYLPNQVQQPMCLHKTYWRGLGADLPTVPPTFNSHFTRTALYIPAPGMQSWECDRQPWRCPYSAQLGNESGWTRGVRREENNWWNPAVESSWIVGTLPVWPYLVVQTLTLASYLDLYFKINDVGLGQKKERKKSWTAEQLN